MFDYENHTTALEKLGEAQEAQYDVRALQREAKHFVNKIDGQWEQSVKAKMGGRPRYTFDKCNPIIDQIMGELEQASFSSQVFMAGGEASKDTAKVYSGLIRSIEQQSGAPRIYSDAGRTVITSGIDGWEIVQKYIDEDAFHQDLAIRKINNYIDRVWFDPASEMRTHEDAEWVFVLTSVSPTAYKKRWPKGSEKSVSAGNDTEVYSYKKEEIVVARLLYKTYKDRELLLLSNDMVVENDDKFKAVQSELADMGVTVSQRRIRKDCMVKSRWLDGEDWLQEAEETVFDYLPVVPVYGNFDISENKILFRGIITNLMDAQRVYNYIKSRQLEEGALAPRKKIFMTREQAAQDTQSLSTMNTNANPVQTYTHVADQAPPYEMQGPTINGGLQQAGDDAKRDINESAGLFSASLGDNPGLQSGYALNQLQNKGDSGTYKYYTALEIAIRHSCRILVKAIPKSYDSSRIVRILDRGNKPSMVTLYEPVMDLETQQTITLNDLSKGLYDVTCSVGRAFKNQQQETVSALTEIGRVVPAVIEAGADIVLNNIQSPGIDKVAERIRQQLIDAGKIPESQLTDEERKALQQKANQPPPPPTPVEQALIDQATGEAAKAQAAAAESMSKIDERGVKTDIAQQAFQLEIDKVGQQFALAFDQLAAQIRKDTATAQLELERQVEQAILTQQQAEKVNAETLAILQELRNPKPVNTNP